MKHPANLIVTNISQLATLHGPARARRGSEMSDLGSIADAAVAIHGDRIIWAGSEADLEQHIERTPNCRTLNAEGNAVIPGLVECHTHLVFAGTREDEFAEKIAGVPYMEIAKKGGGIKRTVRSTRAASENQLLELGRQRIIDALRFGITAIEIKSGYGLNTDTELKILRIARRLATEFPIRIKTTFLGAHDVPPELSRDAYIDLIIQDMLPKVADEGLADFCDAFCERGAFTSEETTRVLEAGRRHGLKLKLHADQLTNGGGAALAAHLGAISADHLDYTDSAGMTAMAQSGTIGVLLPGCIFFMGLKQYPPARTFIEMNVPIAISTDFNPGSCMSLNLPLTMTIAATQCRMTMPETFCATTINAAYAMDVGHECGSIEPGKRADIAVLDTETIQMIPYHFGHNHIRHVLCAGQQVVRDFQYAG